VHHTSFVNADLRNARFSRARALLAGARWTHARVSAETLPFDAHELASLELDVRVSAELSLVD
jgi:hypothetical protein